MEKLMEKLEPEGGLANPNTGDTPSFTKRLYAFKVEQPAMISKGIAGGWPVANGALVGDTMSVTSFSQTLSPQSCDAAHTSPRASLIYLHSCDPSVLVSSLDFFPYSAFRHAGIKTVPVDEGATERP